MKLQQSSHSLGAFSSRAHLEPKLHLRGSIPTAASAPSPCTETSTEGTALFLSDFQLIPKDFGDYIYFLWEKHPLKLRDNGIMEWLGWGGTSKLI